MIAFLENLLISAWYHAWRPAEERISTGGTIVCDCMLQLYDNSARPLKCQKPSPDRWEAARQYLSGELP